MGVEGGRGKVGVEVWFKSGVMLLFVFSVGARTVWWRQLFGCGLFCGAFSMQVGTFGGSEDHAAIMASEAGKLKVFRFGPTRFEYEASFEGSLARK